ncbi:MAG: transglutaminase family protein [Desulfobacterales bacterium]
MISDFSRFLRPTPIINYQDSAVQTFTFKNAGTTDDLLRQAVNLYYAVRDGIRYDPYKFNLTVEGLCAATTLRDKRAWCVPKAVLLAACCRLLGIPARLGFADVKNHLSTERMRKTMQTDVFYWHGYTSIFLEGVWVKATPAFNIELCEKFSLKPLDFDGRTDSIYHPFDLEGNRHMEYVRYLGEFEDVPLDRMMETFSSKYYSTTSFEDADFDREVDRETRS